MWWRRSGFVALFATLLAGSIAIGDVPGAGAQQTDKQRQAAQRIAEASSGLQQAQEQAKTVQAEKARLDGTLTSLQSQVAAAQADLATAQAEVDRLSLVAAMLGAEIDDTQHKLDEASRDARTSAVLLYKRPTSTGVSDLIGSVEGAGSFVEGKQYLERVNAKRRNDLARADRLRKQLDGQKTELATQQQQADDARGQAEAKAQQVEALLSQQQQTRGALVATEADLAVKSETLKSEQAAAEADLAAEDARIRALLAASSNDGPPMGNGTFLRPVGNATITSGFGYRTDPVNGAQAFHAGIDFGVSCGTPIKAGGNGVVIAAGDQGGYGNAVILNHGGGLATLYGHQSAIAVGMGQTVTAGQVIGYVGSTGKSTGCHLHFEVRQNGNAVNPAAYL